MEVKAEEEIFRLDAERYVSASVTSEADHSAVKEGFLFPRPCLFLEL